MEKQIVLQLYDMYARNAYKLALSYLRSPADAEDIVQDVFVKLLQALDTLPDIYRTVIHLHFFEGYTIKEISEILRLGTSAVSMRLTRGKKCSGVFVYKCGRWKSILCP